MLITDCIKNEVLREKRKKYQQINKNLTTFVNKFIKLTTQNANKKETNFFEIYGYFVRIFKMSVV